MVDAIEESLPLAVLDFVGIEYGEGAAASVVGAVGIARAVEAAGYTGYIEVEIFNQAVWDAPADETAATVKSRFADLLS